MFCINYLKSIYNRIKKKYNNKKYSKMKQDDFNEDIYKFPIHISNIYYK
jgi:hypothetical protein